MGLIRSRRAETGRALVMGIVNVTPDSFYPDSRAPATELAIEQGLEMAQAGADVLDVGGESTRPGSDPVPEKTEHERVVPVVEALARGTEVPVSVDTRRASVARACLSAGASIVNDTSAGRDDEAMLSTVAEHGADVILMHRQGEPRTMQQDPSYEDVVADVRGLLAERAEAAIRAGVDDQAITLDPGIGFGKRLAHNLALLRAIPELSELGYPVLVGVSRKSMFGQLLDRDVDRRLAGSLATAAWTASRGADVLRVHDVPETVDVVRVVQVLEEEEQGG